MDGEHLTREEAGAEVGPGWSALVDEFYTAAAALGVARPPVVSARSKMGELFIEVDPTAEMPEALWSLKAAIRERSWSVCDVCGAPGRPRARRPPRQPLRGAPARVELLGDWA